jgi:ferrous iron transport protein B
MSRSGLPKAPLPLIAVGGNPNVGKTTLFNVLTGSRARVGNYPGVTVEKRVGEVNAPGIGRVAVLDVPGTYSLVARTGEEQVALAALIGLGGERHPDVVVMCVDATQLVRGLYMVLQAQEFGLPVVVALTMIDEAGRSAPNAAALSRKLGCPVVPVVAPKGKGLSELWGAIARQLVTRATPSPVWRWQPSRTAEEHIGRVRPALPPGWPQSDAMALWALMSLDGAEELSGITPELTAATRLPPDAGCALDDEAIKGRYQWLDREVAPLVEVPPDRSLTERVDRVLIHPVGGLFLFLLIMFVVFQALFVGAQPAIDLVEKAFLQLGGLAERLLPAGLLADFVTDGLIKGVGAVVVFLPQILLLFLFLGVLEDSGYMARVAYLMDRIMRSMNLHGRAFVPLLSGFACAVPAIMATRTMERKRDRVLTMLVVPLTTCSARLPVYSLIIASLFAGQKLFGVMPASGLLMVFMYGFGVVTALAAAAILSRVVRPLKARRLPFVIELPPYRLPRAGDVLHMMWERSGQFLSQAGTTIVICSIAIWALLAFPRQAHQPSRDWDALARSAVTAEAQSSAVNEKEAERIQQSYAGRLGHTIEPVLQPLGFDWKIGIGIIGAFAAREVFVATMGIIYGAGEVDENDSTQSLRDRIRAERRPSGGPVFTPLVGLSLMIFFALSCQCMSTLAVVRRETGGFRWPAFLFAYMTVLAWLVSFAVYQGGRLLGFT